MKAGKPMQMLITTLFCILLLPVLALAEGSIISWGNWMYASETDLTDLGAVDAGPGHCLGLKPDGSVVAWGNNENGACIVPEPNTDFVAISAGGASGPEVYFQHSLGLKSDRSIVAWGSNTTVPSDNADFIAVSAGRSHFLGLKSNGAIVAWGSNEHGQCDVPEPNTDFVAAAAGGRHSLGLKTDGSIVAWGSNEYGVCDVPEPNSDFIAIAADISISMGLKSDGSVITWGNPIDEPVPNVGFESIAAGKISFLDPLCFAFGIRPESPVSIDEQDELPDEQEESLPTVTQLIGAYPNPFNPQTTVAFTLDRSQHVVIDVFSVTGGRVTELVNRTYAEGEHQITWDGRNASGRSVPSGTYVIRLSTETVVRASKVMLLK